MPTFSNVHAELENSELHPPRDFSLADNDTTLSKNPLGNLQWLDTYWQRPVLGFADASFPPLTLQHGDRYILFSNTTVGSTAIDTSIDSSVALDTSMDSSAEVFPPAENQTVHPTWGDVNLGDIVEYYQNDSRGQSVYEWRAVSPKSGYHIFNLADRTTYYFSGSEWKKHTSSGIAPLAPQVAVTYSELLQMAGSAQLMSGLRYLISDRDIIVTANSKSSIGIEADHTRSINAYGQIKLVGGTEGSISSISIAGVNLINGPVDFNTDLQNTATDLVDAINNHTETHGYNAVDIGAYVFIADAHKRGAAVNGLEITVSTFSIAVATVAMSNGIDSGVNWFKIKYDLANDYISEMSDGRGNVVSCQQQVEAMLGINPIEVFPWGYGNVYNNRVINALLVCFPNEALVADNIIEGNSIAMFSLQNGDYCMSNVISNQSFVRLVTSNECTVSSNEIIVSNIDMELMGGMFVGNKILASNIMGRNITVGPFALNQFNAITLLLPNANITAILQNQMTDGDYNFEGSSFDLRKNTLNNTDMVATGASVHLSDNETANCSIDISEVQSDFEFSRNQIRYNSTISLQRAEGRFADNVMEHTEFIGDDSNTWFQNNKVGTYSMLTLTNFSGSQFFGNKIFSTSIDLTDSSGDFEWNKIDNSTVQMQRHTGECKQNVFVGAEITSNDSGSNIDNNYIDQSNVRLSNTNGDFSSNKATFYSNYYLDGYLGARVLLCELFGSSTLIGSGNTQEQGRIKLDDITTLDISNENSIMYLSQFRTPNSTLKMKTSQINVTCSKQNSTVYHEVHLMPDGALNTDNDELRYGGIFGVPSSGTLTKITGTNTLPNDFVIRAIGSANITIDSTAVGINYANGVNVGILDGAYGHYVKVSQHNGSLIITEAYTS